MNKKIIQYEKCDLVENLLDSSNLTYDENSDNTIDSFSEINLEDVGETIDEKKKKYEVKYFDTIDYIDFLNNKIKTENGKTYDEILKYDEIELDKDHRFIQWIFPTTTPSKCTTHLPIIEINQLKNLISRDRTIISKLVDSYEMMIKYWGLDGIQFIEKISRLNGHDALRFSRMLQSLVYHGREDLALLAYELVSQHIGDENSVLNPLMYVGENLDEMEPLEYLYDLKLKDLHKFGKNIKLMDVWKYHLFKALKETKKDIY